MLLNVPSLEFMQFQNDSFFKDLTNCINVIRRDDALSTVTVFKSGIEDVIFKRLGMRVEIRLVNDPVPNASFSIPPLDKNHIFIKALTDCADNDYGKFISYFSDKKARIGLVDIDKIKVGGVFSTIPVHITIHSGHFNEVFSDEEIASTILHELGHSFSYFFYLLHSSLCSFVSAATASRVAGAKGDAERVIILENGYRIMGLDNVAIRSHLTQTPEQIDASMQTLYIDSTSNDLRSVTGYGMYEIRAAEQLADWFAAKFGAALPSTTCQEKLYRTSRMIALNNTFKSRTSIFSAMIYGAIYISMTIPFPKFFSEVFRDDTISLYDKDDDRIKLLRQNLIDTIKDVKLPDLARVDMLKQIDEIKTIENRVSRSVQREYGDIVKFLKQRLIKNYRNNSNTVELQKTIEELLYNESYVLAAKFKGASK